MHLPDITVTRHPTHTAFTIFRKSTTTDCIIPKDSCHPIKYKLAAVRYLTLWRRNYFFLISAHPVY